MTVSRKIFNATCALPANTATSVATLMKNSALHWGYETTALTQPSMDSILGSELELIPEATIYVGSDANVRGGPLGGSTYKGRPVLGGTNYQLPYGPHGTIDPNQVWLYNQSGCNIAITFVAR